MSGTIPSASQRHRVPVRPMPGLDLVDDQKDIQFVTDGTDFLQIAFGRNDNAGFTLDRLQDHGGDGFPNLPQILNGSADGGSVAVLHVLHLLNQREIGLAIDPFGREREGTAGLAVKSVGSGDEPLALTFETGQFHGNLNGFGTAVGEEALLQVTGSAVCHGLGQVTAEGIDEFLGV